MRAGNEKEEGSVPSLWKQLPWLQTPSDPCGPAGASQGRAFLQHHSEQAASKGVLDSYMNRDRRRRQNGF